MSVFSPRQALAQPEYWYDRTDLPNLDDYATLGEYNQALEDYLAVQNATPAYPMLSPASPNYGKSQAQIDAEALNRNVQYHTNGPGLGVALQNQINQGMPIIQSAYQAVDADGSPLVADPLIAMLEALGVRPDASISQPTGGQYGSGETPRDPRRGSQPTGPAGPGGPANEVPGGGSPPYSIGGGTPTPIPAPPYSIGGGQPQPIPLPGPTRGAGGGGVSASLVPSTPATGPVPGMPEPGLGLGGPSQGLEPGTPAGGSVPPMSEPDFDPIAYARRYGSGSTIDSRYPDWLLLANQRRRAKLTGQRPNDLMNY